MEDTIIRLSLEITTLKNKIAEQQNKIRTLTDKTVEYAEDYLRAEATIEQLIHQGLGS